MQLREKMLESIDIKEAAAFFGLKNPVSLYSKIAAGKIPGAFKVGNRWMFLKDELINFARNFNSANDETQTRDDPWQSVKRNSEKTRTAKLNGARITIRDFRSVESECKNLLDAAQREKPKNMKISGDEK